MGLFSVVPTDASVQHHPRAMSVTPEFLSLLSSLASPCQMPRVRS